MCPELSNTRTSALSCIGFGNTESVIGIARGGVRWSATPVIVTWPGRKKSARAPSETRRSGIGPAVLANAIELAALLGTFWSASSSGRPSVHVCPRDNKIGPV